MCCSGAAPLMMNMPANGTSSNQYNLLTHLYQYFGYLLGCSEYGMGAFPKYMGDGSMASVHQYMDLDIYEVSYFIQQVGLAAASFGVSNSDVEYVGKALMSLFGYKCAPPAVVIPEQGAQLQAICIDSSCPLSPNATCASYPTVMMPANATSSSNMSSTATSTASTMVASQTTNAGARGFAVDMAMGAVAVAAVAFAL